MKKTTLAALALAATASLTLSPAHADTKDDIRTCSEAIAAEKSVDMETHRLKFKSVKGSSKRKITFEAIEKEGDARLKVKCVIKRGEVLEITLAE